MNIAVQDFDPLLCMCGKQSKLTSESPMVQLVERKDLSVLLVYLWVILMNPTRTILVPKTKSSLISLLQDLCPFATLVTDPISEDIQVEEINVSTSGAMTYRAGFIMMPVFVSETSTTVYNIYDGDAPFIDYTRDFLLGALNRFNCIIRNNNVGTARVVWKDPVIGDTLLQEENYDSMFALYIADAYLRTIDPTYPRADQMSNIAGCLNAVRLFESKTSPAEISVRDLSELFQNQTLVPWTTTTSSSDETIVHSPGIGIFDVDRIKSDLFVLLSFTSAMKLGTRSSFTLFIAGFDRYAHLSLFLDLFPKCRMIMWVGENDTGHGSTKFDERITKVFRSVVGSTTLGKYNKEQTSTHPLLFVSGLPLNDIIIAKFAGYSCILAGTAKFKPLQSFVPCFMPADAVTAYSVIAPTPKRVTGAEIKELQNHVRIAIPATIANLNTLCRDKKKWMYTVKNSTSNYSFDEAYLKVLMDAL